MISSMLKMILPYSVVRLQRIKSFYVKKFLLKDLSFSETYPWCSINTWDIIYQHYKKIKNPIILEFGSGVYTFYHIKQLLPLGGKIISIENNLTWYKRTVAEIWGFYLTYFNIKLTCKETENYWQTFLKIYNNEQSELIVEINCFSSSEDYVNYPKDKYDVIIIDGIEREKYVNRVNDDVLLNNNGMFVLYKAGGEYPNWLNNKTLTGEQIYQPEVEQLK